MRQDVESKNANCVQLLRSTYGGAETDARLLLRIILSDFPLTDRINAAQVFWIREYKIGLRDLFELSLELALEDLTFGGQRRKLLYNCLFAFATCDTPKSHQYLMNLLERSTIDFVTADILEAMSRERKMKDWTVIAKFINQKYSISILLSALYSGEFVPMAHPMRSKIVRSAVRLLHHESESVRTFAAKVAAIEQRNIPAVMEALKTLQERSALEVLETLSWRTGSTQ